MTFFFWALITALLGVIPLGLKQHWKAVLLTAPVILFVFWLGYYIYIPSAVWPLGGLIGFSVVVLWGLIAAVLVWLDNKKIDKRNFALPILGVLVFGGTFCSSMPFFRASSYARLLQTPVQRQWSDDIQPVDTKHIRLVPRELAEWQANKQLGEVEGAIGSQFRIATEYMTIQLIKGDLWYVAPLDYNGFRSWTATEYSPGYVMVHAEDPNKQAEVKIGEKFVYTPGAFFGKNLERHLRSSGFTTLGTDIEHFELDDDNKPWWVISAYTLACGMGCNQIDSVITVNPTTGEATQYSLDQVPPWIDQVYPQNYIAKYIEWNGLYKDGWWNAFWSKNNTTEPVNTSFVHGTDGQPYWVTDITSTNASDESLLGLYYTNARTGENRFYRTTGGTEVAILTAVNNKVAYKRLHGASPTLYNIYGVMSYVVPLLGESHTFQGVAIARIDNQQVVEAIDLNAALEAFQGLMIKHETAAPDATHQTTKATGKVMRFSADVRGQDTSYSLIVDSVLNQHIFTGTSRLSPELPLTQVGDTVKIEFIESENIVVPLFGFENVTIEIPSPAIPPASAPASTSAPTTQP
jgi:hypothetical protein